MASQASCRIFVSGGNREASIDKPSSGGNMYKPYFSAAFRGLEKPRNGTRQERCPPCLVSTQVAMTTPLNEDFMKTLALLILEKLKSRHELQALQPPTATEMISSYPIHRQAYVPKTWHSRAVRKILCYNPAWRKAACFFSLNEVIIIILPIP